MESTKFVKFICTDKDAVIPTKAHPNDVGYDLTAIGIYKRISERTTLFETGIAISPPKGYYTEIVPRSSMSKTGYILSNSIGVIDPDYTGSLKIAMTKIDDSLPDISLPFCRCQLILRRNYEDFEMTRVNNLQDTERGDGGFGSSDAKNK